MNDEIPPADHDEYAYDHAWADFLAHFEHEHTSVINGHVYQRIPFGMDHFGQATSRPTCRDCGVARGELHVPYCCWEQCPRCSGQAISCDCDTAN